MLKIKTPHGTLVIENLPTDHEVVVDGEQVNVVWDKGTSNATISLASGAHEVRLQRDGQIIEGPKFTLTDGGTKLWTVSLEENPKSVDSKSTELQSRTASTAATNNENSIAKPKTFSFLDDAPIRKVSVEERMAFEDAAKSHRQLTNGNFKDKFDGWELGGGARSFAFGTPRSDGGRNISTWGKSQNRDTGRLFQCFEVPKGATQLTFKIHGGSDREKLYVALSYRDKEVRRATGRNSNNAFLVEWRVKELQEEVVTLEIVDHFVQAGWPHIGADDFRFVFEEK